MGHRYNQFKSIGENPWLASALLLAMAVWAMFIRLSASGLDEFDETLYASVAREVWRSGDVVNLHIGDAPYLNKPPFYMALTALAYQWFGVNEFSARFMSAAFGVAHVLVGYWVMRTLFGGGRAFIAMVLLLAHYHFLAVARAGRMESLVSLCILAGFGALLKCRTDGRWWLAVGLATGLGVLAKGPMGAMLLVIALPCLVFDSAMRQSLTVPRALGAAGVAALVSLPWYATQLVAYGSEYVEVFLGQQVLERMTTSLHGPERGPMYFLHRITSYQFGTWSLLAPAALLLVAYRAFRGHSVKYVYLAAYTLVLLLVFSLLVKTKLHQYIFSIYVPLAMCAALLIERLGRAWAPAPGMFVVLALITLVIYPLQKDARNHSLPALAPALKMIAVHGGGPLVSFGVNPQGPIFYADAPVEALPNLQAMRRRLSASCAYGLLSADAYGLSRVTVEGARVLSRTAEHVLIASPLCRDAVMAALGERTGTPTAAAP